MISLSSQQPQGSSPTSQSRSQAVTASSADRIVPKPVPSSQAEDPRRYQISQLRRRFSPIGSVASDGATSLCFKLHPSDPDFPFELAFLDCDLRVPEDYPEERPKLLIRNKNIPRGFSINIERGWDRLADERRNATLLGLTTALDKNLEAILSEQKVDTVKLVAFQGVKDTRHVEPQKEAEKVLHHTPGVKSQAAAAVPTPSPPPRRFVPEPSYTREQISEAKARRAQEVRQLEARMGRMPVFRRSADGIVYTLPIEPKRRSELPSGLSSVVTIHLIVPLLYPLQNLRVQLNEADSADAEPVEELFVEKAAAQNQMNLTSLMNYLAQNLHTLSKEAKAKAPVPIPEVTPESEAPDVTESGPKHAPVQGKDKAHIQYIQRPPEWDVNHGEGGSDEDSFDSEDTDEGGANIGESGEDDDDAAMPLAEDTPERGTMISFPSIELHGIELLQVTVLGITVKCDRCKTVNEMRGLKPGQEKTEHCKKCTAPMAVKFRQQLVHEHSTRAGFIDAAGCKVADLLPSTFVPTCARCSTPGIELVSVRGESVTNICRECHSKFTFKIPDVRFLLVTPGSLPPPAAGPRKKQEKLGIHVGEPLPRAGACPHYKKSYRWFRFSCCHRVHSCDKCHDDAEDHINEWANRMICGWCSREQNYSPEACNYCGRSVIGKKGRGFWEGGKGTRDRNLMSRKDPRKYKRVGGSQVGKAGKKD